MKRILLKLSGESLCSQDGYGIDADKLNYYVEEMVPILKNGYQVGVVLGGGNIFRGVQGTKRGFDRIQGDYMGMLATTINSIALKSELEERGFTVKLLSGLPIDRVAEPMSSSLAISYLEKGFVVIISGGTGNPFFTTDSAGALRALEIKADMILKGTRVDGVYDKDPEKFPDAVKYSQLSYDEAIEKNLRIMDQTAFTLCKENNMPIMVFNINIKGTLAKILNGEQLGTVVKNY